MDCSMEKNSMDRFMDALCSAQRNPNIPAECDWFAPLLGDWSFTYTEPCGRTVQGEWLFRRALDGMAIEDLFICPSRATREIAPQPDAEYGAAIRMFNAEKQCYDMTYVCSKYTVRLTVQRIDGAIVCAVIDDPDSRWMFDRIGPDAFHWQNVKVLPDGTLHINCEVDAVRVPSKAHGTDGEEKRG